MNNPLKFPVDNLDSNQPLRNKFKDSVRKTAYVEKDGIGKEVLSISSLLSPIITDLDVQIKMPMEIVEMISELSEANNQSHYYVIIQAIINQYNNSLLKSTKPEGFESIVNYLNSR